MDKDLISEGCARENLNERQQEPIQEQPEPEDTQNRQFRRGRPHQNSRRGGYRVTITDENGQSSTRNMKGSDVLLLGRGERIQVEWNEFNQPIGEGAGILGSFLRIVASDFDNFPLKYPNWHKMPDQLKNHAYTNIIKTHFIVNDAEHKHFILMALGANWREAKYKLFKDERDRTCNLQDLKNNVPNGLTKEDWEANVDYLTRPDTIAMASRNAQNRGLKKIHHTSGSLSFARRRGYMEEEDDRPVNFKELYEVTHLNKEGNPCNEEAATVMEKLKECENHHSSSEANANNDILVRVIGPDHPGGLGMGPTPTQVYGSTSSTKSFKAHSRKRTKNPNNVTLQNEVERLKAENMSLRSQIDELMNQIKPRLDEMEGSRMAQIEAERKRIAEFEALLIPMAEMKGRMDAVAEIETQMKAIEEKWIQNYLRGRSSSNACRGSGTNRDQSPESCNK